MNFFPGTRGTRDPISTERVKARVAERQRLRLLLDTQRQRQRYADDEERAELAVQITATRNQLTQLERKS